MTAPAAFDPRPGERFAAALLSAGLSGSPAAVEITWREIPARQLPDVLDAMAALSRDLLRELGVAEAAQQAIRARLLTAAIEADGS